MVIQFQLAEMGLLLQLHFSERGGLFAGNNEYRQLAKPGCDTGALVLSRKSRFGKK
jgi:hypothetical protein